MTQLTRETLDDLEYLKGEVRVLSGAVGYLLRRDLSEGGDPRSFLRELRKIVRENANEELLAGADEMVDRLAGVLNAGDSNQDDSELERRRQAQREGSRPIR